MLPKDDSCPTRPSLLERLKDTENQQSWEEFNAVYGPLIRGFALKAGCTETEADEVTQETMAAAAQHLPEFRYDPKRCSFKTWLLNLSRWRVTDQLRKRLPLAPRPASSDASEEGTRTAIIDRVPDPAGVELEKLWDGEWRETLLQQASARVKAQVDLKRWQIFDLYVLKGWKPREVARALGVNVGWVYLTKHRVGRLLKQELRNLEATLL
ncbi:MAG TPA: sigma-70 family RNA polymerase sigma factor [Verrucomicrobiae bacterium]